MKRFLLLAGVPAVAVAAGLALWLQGGRYEETENAYVKAHMIAVTADVSGRVMEVGVRDNEPVAAGALLFRIDPVPFELAVVRAEAQMGVVRTELEGLRAEHRVALADATEAEERIGFLARQLERQSKLKERGMGLESSYDEARHNLEAARRRLESSREKAARVLAALGGDAKLPVEGHPSFLAARAARDAGRDELSRVRVLAPAAGIVSNMRLQPGERVERGVPVFSLIESRPVWIEANFKETQLTHMREGQEVTVVADAYPDAKWRGRVSTIAPATKAEFALLPAQNSSGNWVKVVQRVPVLIALDSFPDGQTPLRAGMTVTARVDTGHVRSLSALR
ncbi:MAG TPA: HlyD family secretion protein [Burkholderiales bacterium]|jgi:membrane fusion protein (multidrug efflux system)